jgi:hypothetical protein
MFASGHRHPSSLLSTVLCLLCAVNGCAQSHRAAGKVVGGKQGTAMKYSHGDDGPQPNPSLSPEQVVAIQLQALQRNDTPAKDSGIAVAFRFASPGNQAVTGPLANFILLVKNPLYLPLLDHKSIERGPMKIDGDKAEQRVTLTSATGEKVVYLFTLSKQADGQYQDCWMTDGVARLRGDGLPKGEQVARGNGHLRTARLA